MFGILGIVLLWWAFTCDDPKNPKPKPVAQPRRLPLPRLKEPAPMDSLVLVAVISVIAIAGCIAFVVWVATHPQPLAP